MKQLAFFFLVIMALSSSGSADAQKSDPQQPKPKAATAISPGRQKLEAAFTYQSKLADSTVTIDEVIENWSAVARERDVRQDPEAVAIAFGSEGLLELQKGEKLRADSLLARSIPLFRLKHSKAYFLVAFADLERDLRHYKRALQAYDEIVNTMDSLPELWDIQFYRLSGYAPFAYAIDASLGIAQIGKADPEHHKKAIELLSETMGRHPEDALGLMDLVALHYLGAIKNEQYKFKLDLLCSRKPELRIVSETFEKEISKKEER
jgi:tetratricopeptide (TPR) repeat protein